jgi:hypothetical protein
MRSNGVRSRIHASMRAANESRLCCGRLGRRWKGAMRDDAQCCASKVTSNGVRSNVQIRADHFSVSRRSIRTTRRRSALGATGVRGVRGW